MQNDINKKLSDPNAIITPGGGSLFGRVKRNNSSFTINIGAPDSNFYAPELPTNTPTASVADAKNVQKTTTAVRIFVKIFIFIIIFETIIGIAVPVAMIFVGPEGIENWLNDVTSGLNEWLDDGDGDGEDNKNSSSTSDDQALIEGITDIGWRNQSNSREIIFDGGRIYMSNLHEGTQLEVYEILSLFSPREEYGEEFEGNSYNFRHLFTISPVDSSDENEIRRMTIYYSSDTPERVIVEVDDERGWEFYSKMSSLETKTRQEVYQLLFETEKEMENVQIW